jgi:hypothetical protein
MWEAIFICFGHGCATRRLPERTLFMDNFAQLSFSTGRLFD